MRRKSSQRVQIVLIPEGESLEINVRDQSTTPFGPDHGDVAAPSLDDRLAGLAVTRGWGTFLIKSVVDMLSREFPRLKSFCTLSPVPGFARWLAAQLQERDKMPMKIAAALDAVGRGADEGLVAVLDRHGRFQARRVNTQRQAFLGHAQASRRGGEPLRARNLKRHDRRITPDGLRLDVVRDDAANANRYRIARRDVAGM